MFRRLTVADRDPRLGDVLERGGRRITIRQEPTRLVPYIVLDRGGLTRIGLDALRGQPLQCEIVWRDGWEYWTQTGRCFSPVYPPFRYVKRADGGPVLWPIDAGAWC